MDYVSWHIYSSGDYSFKQDALSLYVLSPIQAETKMIQKSILFCLYGLREIHACFVLYLKVNFDFLEAAYLGLLKEYIEF